MNQAKALPTSVVRRFNRGYTRLIGVLDEGLHNSAYSLTEARILWELAHRSRASAREVGESLALDPGYLSRLLKRLQKAGLVSSERSAADGRQSVLALTSQGRAEFSRLDALSESGVEDLLRPLSEGQRERLVQSMETIEGLLMPEQSGGFCLLREPLPGELGWIVQKHGELYAREYGWGERFEGLVAGVVAQYAAHHDPTRERVWIAELDGTPAGSVMVVKKNEEVAQLRLLLLDPRARGRGLGKALVDAAVTFAANAGYRMMTLWTQGQLDAARGIYVKAGFRRVKEEAHTHFGPEILGEEWERELC